MPREREPMTAVRRPRDRKQQILTAASELFREHGYHNISVSDVTARVDITTSALYRHYRNKNSLLYHAVLAGIESLNESVGGATDLYTLLTTLSATSVERRGLPLLWQREARYLDDDQREMLRKKLRFSTSRISELVQAHRSDLSDSDSRLLAYSILAVFSSSSSHRISMPPRQMEALLFDLSARVSLSPIGSADPDVPAARTEVISIPVSRREQLLTAAIQLFDERGYRTVSNEDIGAACGTTGQNVYNHFDTKLDILSTAITRGFDRRDLAVRQALSQVGDSSQTLDILLGVHIAFAREDGHLIGLMATELAELPDNTRKACVQAQRDYLELWVRALSEVRPGLDATEAKFTVSAAMTLIGNAIRIGSVRRRADLADRLTEICIALMTETSDPAASLVDAGVGATP